MAGERGLSEEGVEDVAVVGIKRGLAALNSAFFTRSRC